MRSPRSVRRRRARTPSRNSDTISADDSGSSRISAGWVPAIVRPRSRCAASSGSRRIWSRSASNSAASAREVGRAVPLGIDGPPLETCIIPTRGAQLQMSAKRRRRISTAATRRASRGSVGSMRARARRRPTSCRTPTRRPPRSGVSLSGKTRKIVPSAMPAASAIWRVVTAEPWASSSGSVAATISARRSDGGSAVARARLAGAGSARAGARRHAASLHE